MISQREIGVSHMKYFYCAKIPHFREIGTFDTLEDKFLVLGCHNPTVQLYVQWNCHCIKGNNPWPSYIGNGIGKH